MSFWRICPSQHRRSERLDMPSLFDSPDARGDTQEMDTSVSQGSNKRDGVGAEVQRNGRQLRRTASRTKQDGAASGSTMAVVAERRADSKVEQKGINKIMLKATLRTRQTMRDLSSTVWDTLLVNASSPEVDTVQKQAQIHAEKERQERRGHSRCHHSYGLTWAWPSVFRKGETSIRITMNIVPPEKRLLVLEALGQAEAERLLHPQPWCDSCRRFRKIS